MKQRIGQFMLMFILLLAVGLIAGCSSSSEEAGSETGDNAEAEATDGKTKLRMTWWGSQDRHDRTQQVIDLYEEQNPNIEIEAQFTGWDGYWEKIATQAAGGNLPDIIQMDYKYLSDYTANELLANLTPQVESGALNLDDVAPQYLDGGKVDGNLYAVNIGANAHAIAVDPALFEKAGVPMLEPGYTWQDLQDAAKKISDELGEGVYGTQPAAGIMGFKHYLRENGKSLYNTEGTGLGYEDDQLLVDYLTITKEMLDAGSAAPPDLFMTAASNVEQMPIITGKTAMLMDMHSNQLVAMEEAAGRPLELILQPMLEGGEYGHYVKPGQFLAVAATSKHQEEAAKFIDFFTNSLEANEILNAERGVPVSEKVREHLKPNLSEAGQKMFEFLDLVAEYSKEIDPPDPVGATEIESYFKTQIEDAIYYGQITPEAAAEAFRQKGTEILSANK